MITDHLMRLGGGSVQFRPDFPVSKSNEILALIDEDASGAGADIMLTPVHMPVSLGDTVISAAATHAGHITKSANRLSLEWDGLGWWLDTYIESDISKTAGTPTQWLTTLGAINDLTVGTVSGGSNVTREFQAHSVTYRHALDDVAARGGWEYRINPDGSIDAGTSVFTSPPTTVVTRKPGGAGGAYRGVDGGVLEHSIDVSGLTTKVVPLLSDDTVPDGVTAGTAATQALSLKTRNGNTPTRVEVITSPFNNDTEAFVAADALLAERVLRRAAKVSSTTHHISEIVKVGDEVYAYDLAAGLLDTTNQITHEGQRISPILLRVISMSIPISGGGVYIRPCAASPTLIDVTDWVEWERGEASWTIGDLTSYPAQRQPFDFGGLPSLVAGTANRTSPALERLLKTGTRVGASPWTSYSPALTNITIGNGTQQHWYRIVGEDTYEVSNEIVFGSTTSFSGWPTIAPPSALDYNVMPLGQSYYLDSGTANHVGTILSNGTTQIGPCHTTTGSSVSFPDATTPFTWTTGDTLKQTYRAKF